MDFSNRSVSAQPPVAAPAHTPAAAGGHKKTKEDGGWQRVSSIVLGAAVVVLLIAVVIFLGVGNSNAESKYVDTNKLQAVFLNTGQVYFGNIKTLNDKFFVLSNIYYLQTSGGSSSSSSSSNTSVSLVKLGCELHMPYDQMVINRDQVTFWENLQSDGQVAKAVSTFQKDNPDGQKCADQSSSSSTNSGSSVQNAQTSTNPSNSTTTP